MRIFSNSPGLGGCLALSLIFTAAATPVQAQDADVGAAETPAEMFLLLVPSRDSPEIQHDIEVATQRQRVAANQREQTERWRTSAKLRVDDMERHIDSIKDRIKIAKQRKQDADRLRLEAERQAAERQKELLERRQSLREAEIDLLKKKAEQANMERQALELELQLMTKRNEPVRAAPGTVERASFDQVVSQLERKTLEAQRAAATTIMAVAEYERKVVEQRIAILDAQQAVVRGR